MHYFANLPLRDWAWILVSVLAIIWMERYIQHMPDAMHDILGNVLELIFTTAALGAVANIIGVFTSAQPHERSQRNGPVFEVAGLLMMAAAPLVYSSSQLWIVVQQVAVESDVHEGPVWSGLILAAVYLNRIITVFPRYRRGSRRAR